ncbi:hypothetical protein ALQ33_100685 [Pseudomonas syringae pv. philadelphi]|uniref:Uncharacterized protein n=1 Tax=Pseudomonas syringae pv. philadelphi TaxID=251706 RepID=A0A3M3Z7N7_9PSED|nr:hypothetical protein ALQ33_100685 [Pseudomonas syringae pv. philadelphi]
MPDTWHKGGSDDNRVDAFLFPDGLLLTRPGQRLHACRPNH